MKNIFTPEHDAIIRECYPISPNLAAEKLPGFTLQQIRVRAYRLNIKHRKRWTMRQRSIIRDHWGKPTWKDVVGELANHTQAQISKMACRMGVSARKQWKITEHIALMKDWGGPMSKSQLEAKYGVSYSSLRSKIQELKKLENKFT